MVKFKRSISHLYFKNNRGLLKFKRSQAHVEIMISFAIFIGALVFVFLYINPFAKVSANDDNLNSVEKIILESLSHDVGKLSVVSYDNARWCYNVDFSKYSGNNYIETSETETGYKKYNIYFSDIFTSSIALHNTACDSSQYKLGVFTNETMISYEALKDIKNQCENGCAEFKKAKGINFDFSFNCKELDGTAIADASFSKGVPAGVEAGAKEFPIRAIGNDGRIHEIIFNLRVW